MLGEAQPLLAPEQRQLGLALAGAIPQDLEEADLTTVLCAKTHHFAEPEQTGAVLARVPALVRATAAGERLLHLVCRNTGRTILVREDRRGGATQHLWLQPSEDEFGAAVPAGNEPAEIERDDGVIRRALEYASMQYLAGLLLAQRLAEFELLYDLASQHAKRVDLNVTQAARDEIDHAHGSERVARLGSQECAGVKAQVRRPRDQRIAVEARILGGVRHDQQVLLKDRLGAEGRFERRLAYPEPDFGLEELPPFGDQVDDRNRGSADGGRQSRDVVEILLARGVEYIVLGERREPGGFSRVVCKLHVRNARPTPSSTPPYNADPPQPSRTKLQPN